MRQQLNLRLMTREGDQGSLRNADVPRALVRDMYTKSWSAFDRLVAIVPPGGSIGYASFKLIRNYEHSNSNIFIMKIVLN